MSYPTPFWEIPPYSYTTPFYKKFFIPFPLLRFLGSSIPLPPLKKGGWHYGSSPANEFFIKISSIFMTAVFVIK